MIVEGDWGQELSPNLLRFACQCQEASSALLTWCPWQTLVTEVLNCWRLMLQLPCLLAFSLPFVSVCDCHSLHADAVLIFKKVYSTGNESVFGLLNARWLHLIHRTQFAFHAVIVVHQPGKLSAVLIDSPGISFLEVHLLRSLLLDRQQTMLDLEGRSSFWFPYLLYPSHDRRDMFLGSRLCWVEETEIPDTPRDINSEATTKVADKWIQFWNWKSRFQSVILSDVGFTDILGRPRGLPNWRFSASPRVLERQRRTYVRNGKPCFGWELVQDCWMIHLVTGLFVNIEKFPYDCADINYFILALW